MIPGITGSLVSADAAERLFPTALRGHLGESERGRAQARMRSWYSALHSSAGPALSARGVFDRVASPLASHLGYRAVTTGSSARAYRALLHAPPGVAAVLVVTPWGQDLSGAWSEAIGLAIEHRVRWCFCLSGNRLRIADGKRTYSRRHVELDLETVFTDERSFAVFWGLLRADALRSAPGPSVLDRAVEISERHRAGVRESLQQGVRDALAELSAAFRHAVKRHAFTGEAAGRAFDESLIVVYRILFLLFAEARGLVPQWHPVYRDSYTIEGLRRPVEEAAPVVGVWETLQAIARLAHRGCRAGSLTVTPFNGRLFAPGGAPMADSVPLDDGKVAGALRALTTRRGPGGREPISYGDLGVEQLGGVYERLLDLGPALAGGGFARSERRKSTGSFYTPRSLTEYLVRRTLAPLVENRTSAEILSLRVLDPAMGSGAFLVAACRYLAAAYERALLDETAMPASEITDAERASFRRIVAQRCLYGVDVNPMAVQLSRLSLWLATLAANSPLTFLDHNIRAGNSLVGAAPEDILRQPPPGRRAPRRPAPLPLFGDAALDSSIAEAVGVRGAIATEPGETLPQIKAKERELSQLEQHGSVARRWKQLADAWCAGWFAETAGREMIRQSFGSISDRLFGRSSMLPAQAADRLLTTCGALARAHGFFHWQFEFPEAFFDRAGTPVSEPGFDAVIGNPPWEMLRGDRGGTIDRARAKQTASDLITFARGSGLYRLQGDGHANLYQLFLERALQLTRRRGRIGLVLPSGLLTDHGAAPLRRALLERTRIDTFAAFDNGERIFPVHRSLKFALIAAESGSPTSSIPARFGLRNAAALDMLPDTGGDSDAVAVTRSFIETTNGPSLSIPDIRSGRDLDIVAAIASGSPALAHPEGWHASFGRELNATDDRRHFVSGSSGIRVIEGKHLSAFRVALNQSQLAIPARVAERLRRGAGRAPSAAPRLSRCLVPDQPSDADRGRRPPGRPHDPHDLLPARAAAIGGPALSLRNAQQLRGRLPRTHAHWQPRHDINHRATAGAGRGADDLGLPNDRGGGARPRRRHGGPYDGRTPASRGGTPLRPDPRAVRARAVDLSARGHRGEKGEPRCLCSIVSGLRRLPQAQAFPRRAAAAARAPCHDTTIAFPSGPSGC